MDNQAELRRRFQRLADHLDPVKRKERGSERALTNKQEPRAKGHGKRPFISVHFRCCNVFQRLYRHRDGDRYEGYCPKCCRRLTVPIGADGTDLRTFQAE